MEIFIQYNENGKAAVQKVISFAITHNSGGEEWRELPSLSQFSAAEFPITMQAPSKRENKQSGKQKIEQK